MPTSHKLPRSADRRRPLDAVYNERMREVFYQFVVFGGFAWLAYFLISTTADNLASRGMQTGLGFLSVTAGFDIDFKLIEYAPGVGTYGRIFVVGILNTLFISFFVIVASTTLAFTVGIMRLSSNWLVSRMALVYVEVIRNTPVLVHLVFWHVTILGLLPQVAQSHDAFGLGIAFVNNRGFYIPAPAADQPLWTIAAALVVALAAIIPLRRWARARQDATGRQFPVFWGSLGLILGLPAIVFLASGTPLGWEIPALGVFNYSGGLRLPPSFVTLFIALTLYHAAYKAETVRAGIESVHGGQMEAAHALGFRPGQALRFILVPQAMRAIIPPLISGWLGAARNTSLGIAVAYPELVGVFMHTSLNQAGHAVEIVAMTMGFYMLLSLLIALVLNAYDKRLRAAGG